MDRIANLGQTLTSSGQSNYSHITMAPPDPILGVTTAFKNDKDPNKMNLGVGAYRTDEGLPYIFDVVKKAERQILDDSKINKEYLPIDGYKPFLESSQNLILGQNCQAVKEGRVASVQALSGTGA